MIEVKDNLQLIQDIIINTVRKMYILYISKYFVNEKVSFMYGLSDY